MAFLKTFTTVFFLPGTLLLKQMGIPVEEDGGIFRSFVNSVFWGAVFLGIGLKFWM
ncbi:MAG: hypothetical protein R3D32_02105 [Nitratireductor sp.]